MKFRFELGDLVSTTQHPKAIFRIFLIYQDHGGPGQHRYWGSDSTGEMYGAYEAELTKAT